MAGITRQAMADPRRQCCGERDGEDGGAGPGAAILRALLQQAMTGVYSLGSCKKPVADITWHCLGLTFQGSKHHAESQAG